MGLSLVVTERNRKGETNACIKRMTKEKMVIKICCKYYDREEGQQKDKILIIKHINFVIRKLGLKFQMRSAGDSED